MLTFGVYEKMLSSLVNIQMRKDWRAIVLFIPEIEDLICIVQKKGQKKGLEPNREIYLGSKSYLFIYSYNKYLFSIYCN